MGPKLVLGSKTTRIWLKLSLALVSVCHGFYYDFRINTTGVSHVTGVSHDTLPREVLTEMNPNRVVVKSSSGDHIDVSVVPHGNSTYIRTEEHPVEFKKVSNEPESYSVVLLLRV